MKFYLNYFYVLINKNEFLSTKVINKKLNFPAKFIFLLYKLFLMEYTKNFSDKRNVFEIKKPPCGGLVLMTY